MNKTPKRFRTRFENTMENPIFNFFLFWSKRSNFVFYIRNMDLLISKLLSNSILDIGKWSNWNYAQLRICVFSVWPLPKVKNWFKKQFWNKKVHLFIVKKNIGAFSQTNKKLKIGFPIVFSHFARKGLGFFMLERYFFHQTPCIYLLNSRGGCQTSDLNSLIYQNRNSRFQYFSLTGKLVFSWQPCLSFERISVRILIKSSYK